MRYRGEILDVRNIFRAASDRLMADFLESSEIGHQGGKGTLREDALSDFLIKNLPTRYGVGRGQVINSNNYTSGQLDIIIHDPLNCPTIISSPSHSIFPIESVYGAISIKSSLSSAELKDSYDNIASLNKIVDRSSFDAGGRGFMIGMAYPRPVTVVFSYKTDRSLDAISKQVSILDNALADISLRPDFICVLGEGIIGPRNPIRGNFNTFLLSKKMEELCAIRMTKRHTLFKFYLQMLRELSQVNLRPLDLAHYENTPKLIGPYRVSRHDTFALTKDGGPPPTQGTRLTIIAIKDIVERSCQCTRKEAFESWLGGIPQGPSEALSLDSIVYCYNPNCLPSIRVVKPQADASENLSYNSYFHPYQIYIDGSEYFVDMSALPNGSFEDNPDLTLDELMSG